MSNLRKWWFISIGTVFALAFINLNEFSKTDANVSELPKEKKVILPEGKGTDLLKKMLLETGLYNHPNIASLVDWLERLNSELVKQKTIELENLKSNGVADNQDHINEIRVAIAELKKKTKQLIVNKDFTLADFNYFVRSNYDLHDLITDPDDVAATNILMRLNEQEFTSLIEGGKEKADTTDNSIDTWLLIGYAYQSGNGVAEDIGKAKEAYEKAWSFGSPVGAKGLKNIYLENNDFESAYTWSIRAGEKCKICEKKLSVSQRQMLTKLAKIKQNLK